MKIYKKCNCCGNEFKILPKDYKQNNLGYWFNCVCNSTMLVKKSSNNSKKVGENESNNSNYIDKFIVPSTTNKLVTALKGRKWHYKR